MPALGADMDAGTVIEWLVKSGDAVHRGDVVAVVDTSKAAIEVECFADGTIEAILVPTGTEVPVGTVLATITTAEAPAAAPEPPAAAPAAPEQAAPEQAVPVPAPAHPADHYVLSPLVRRLAHDLGVDADAVPGTGPGGRVTRTDVQTAARAAAAPAPAVRLRVSPYARRLAAELGVDMARVTPRRSDGAILPIHAADVRAAAAATPAAPAVPAQDARAARQAATRTAIAALMSRSKREVPHYYLSTTVDLGTGVAWLRDRNRDLPVTKRLVPAALLLKATALAARKVPELNGFWVDDAFRPGGSVHLGVAVAIRGGGLVAPAIHDADRLPLEDLMAALRDLVARARGGRLRGSEMSDPTLTVTNLGDQGVEAVFGVIYPPQVALVGFGKVVDRPHAVGGLIGVRPVVTLTLSADHRATDGWTGARFLNTVERLLQHPEEL
jgi:pyruvate dehydrogenase E2 component (dihydrolipoamide acetyltransferase)